MLSVDGCSVIDESQVAVGGYFTYCERIYLNPATGTGPDWQDILPAALYRVSLPRDSASSRKLFAQVRLPPPVPLETFDGSEGLRFLHIIKTGGDSPQRQTVVSAPLWVFLQNDQGCVKMISSPMAARRGVARALSPAARDARARLCHL
jgi:hypothetical protein